MRAHARDAAVCMRTLRAQSDESAGTMADRPGNDENICKHGCFLLSRYYFDVDKQAVKDKRACEHDFCASVCLCVDRQVRTNTCGAYNYGLIVNLKVDSLRTRWRTFYLKLTF